MRSPFSLTVLTLLVVLTLLCGCVKPRIDLAVASQANINPDHTGRPSPVIVKVYEMRSDLAFSQSDFHPLFESPVQVLGAELLAADEMVLVPGEARRITYDPVSEARFLGVLAGFRQMERAKWKIVTPVDAEKVNKVGIELRDVTVELIPQGEVSGWDPAEAVKEFNNPSGDSASAGEGGKGEAASAAEVEKKSSMRRHPSFTPWVER